MFQEEKSTIRGQQKTFGCSVRGGRRDACSLVCSLHATIFPQYTAAKSKLDDAQEY